MVDKKYKVLVEEWIPIYANTLADLECNQNLSSHLISIEIMLNKVLETIRRAELSCQNVEKLKTLSFLVFCMQQEVLNLKLGIISWQRKQILSLKRETVDDWKALLLQDVKSE